MKNWTEPLRYCRSLEEIDGDYLRSIGAKTLLCDLDNTLVFWHTRDCLPGAQAWLDARKAEGFQILIFSNAAGTRARDFAREQGIAALPYAGKPWPFAFRHVKAAADSPKENWVAIGDQIFTDVLCAGMHGVKALYVYPYSEKEWGWTRFVRKLERRVLKRRGLFCAN